MECRRRPTTTWQAGRQRAKRGTVASLCLSSCGCCKMRIRVRVGHPGGAGRTSHRHTVFGRAQPSHHGLIACLLPNSYTPSSVLYQSLPPPFNPNPELKGSQHSAHFECAEDLLNLQDCRESAQWMWMSHRHTVFGRAQPSHHGLIACLLQIPTLPPVSSINPCLHPSTLILSSRSHNIPQILNAQRIC